MISTKMSLLSALLAVSLTAALAQTPDSTKASVTSRKTNGPAVAPNQRRGGPDAVAEPEMNLRLNALNGVGTAPLIWRIDTRYEGLRGTPYFQSAWAKGQIELINGRKYTDVPIKFDAHRQALILLRPKQGNDSIIIDQQTVHRFRLSVPTDTSGREYLFQRYPTAKINDPVLREGYFLVLYEGKTALLKRVVKTFRPADFKGAYTSNTTYDAYSDDNAYYILKPDQTLTKVKLSKKALLDALADKGDGLKKFADTQKLGVKTEREAVALVQHYDSL